MKIIKCLELGTMVTDTISGVKGMLTHLVIDMDEQKTYIFQPKSLNPDTGEPSERLWITESRIKGGIYQNLEVPTELLGSKAEDIATGFKGKIVNVLYHINGCLHVELKPEGLNSKGGTFHPEEFDIRRIKGEKIKPLSKDEKKESIKKTPSPEKMLPKQLH